jgi:hypothetical protein
LGQQGDDIVSLPAPPPPNPAARRSAIDAALRKFDGVEDADAPRTPQRRPRIFDWASSHKRATGGLVTAALIAIVGIPAMQIALRDQPPETALERAAPSPVGAGTEPVPGHAATGVAEMPAQPEAAVPVARSEPAEAQVAAPEPAKEEPSLGYAADDSVQKARPAWIAPMAAPPAPPVAAAPPAPPPPAPPPPPPPPPMAERDAADAVAAQSGNIVVTGQKARRQNMDSPMPGTVVAGEGAYADFQEKLQSAFRANDRRAILGLVGIPMQVNFNGDVRTYRSRDDVGRDFGRIFTAEVRSAVLSGEASRHLTVAQSGSSWRIRAVRP